MTRRRVLREPRISPLVRRERQVARELSRPSLVPARSAAELRPDRNAPSPSTGSWGAARRPRAGYMQLHKDDRPVRVRGYHVNAHTRRRAGWRSKVRARARTVSLSRPSASAPRGMVVGVRGYDVRPHRRSRPTR